MKIYRRMRRNLSWPMNSIYPEDITYLGQILNVNISQRTPVWITSKSTKYHMDQHCCGIKNPIELELSEAKNKVYILVKNVAAKIFNFFT